LTGKHVIEDVLKATIDDKLFSPRGSEIAFLLCSSDNGAFLLLKRDQRLILKILIFLLILFFLIFLFFDKLSKSWVLEFE
jgi:hypothetical protein